MKSTLVIVLFFLLFPFTVFTQESKDTPTQQIETPEEKEKREFREFKEFKERQNREAAEKENSASKTNPKEKKWYVYLQGSAGNAGTEFEKGTVQSGKLGFEYRILPFFGIGLGVGNNKLNLTSRDSSSGLILAYLLLSAPYTTTTPESTQSAQTNRLFLATILAAPVSYNYSYSTAQVDFNFHFNQDKFFDPYAGLGLIAGICGPAYPCSITGGEFKLGSQFNFDSFFLFLQGQAQLLTIKESGLPAFQSQNLIGSLGAGFRF